MTWHDHPSRQIHKYFIKQKWLCVMYLMDVQRMETAQTIKRCDVKIHQNSLCNDSMQEIYLDWLNTLWTHWINWIRKTPLKKCKMRPIVPYFYIGYRTPFVSEVSYPGYGVIPMPISVAAKMTGYLQVKNLAFLQSAGVKVRVWMKQLRGFASDFAFSPIAVHIQLNGTWLLVERFSTQS